MAADYASERRAAGRSVPADVDLLAGREREPAMKLFDPHIHMTSRTTDDYEAMAAAGIAAIVEPAFWLGPAAHARRHLRGLLPALLGWERFRASQFGIRHFCTIVAEPEGGEQPARRAGRDRAACRATSRRTASWRSARSATTT